MKKKLNGRIGIEYDPRQLMNAVIEIEATKPWRTNITTTTTTT